MKRGKYYGDGNTLSIFAANKMNLLKIVGCVAIHATIRTAATMATRSVAR